MALLYFGLRGPCVPATRLRNGGKNPRPAGGLQHVYRTLIPCRYFCSLPFLVARRRRSAFGRRVHDTQHIFAVLGVISCMSDYHKTVKKTCFCSICAPITGAFCAGLLRLARFLWERADARFGPPSELAGIRLAPSRGLQAPYSELCNRNSHLQSRSYCSLPRTAWIIRTKSFRSRRWGEFIKRSFLQRVKAAATL
jgi:hypothetical protein